MRYGRCRDSWQEGPVVQTGSPGLRLVQDLRLTLWTLHWLSPLIKVDSEPESSTDCCSPNNGSDSSDFTNWNFFCILQLMNISRSWRQISKSPETAGLKISDFCMQIDSNGEKCDNQCRRGLCWGMGSPDPQNYKQKLLKRTDCGERGLAGESDLQK